VAFYSQLTPSVVLIGHSGVTRKGATSNVARGGHTLCCSVDCCGFILVEIRFFTK